MQFARMTLTLPPKNKRMENDTTKPPIIPFEGSPLPPPTLASNRKSQSSAPPSSSAIQRQQQERRPVTTAPTHIIVSGDALKHYPTYNYFRGKEDLPFNNKTAESAAFGKSAASASSISSPPSASTPRGGSSTSSRSTGPSKIHPVLQTSSSSKAVVSSYSPSSTKSPLSTMAAPLASKSSLTASASLNNRPSEFQGPPRRHPPGPRTSSKKYLDPTFFGGANPPGVGGGGKGGRGTEERKSSVTSIVSSILGSSSTLQKTYTVHAPPEHVHKGMNYIRTTKYTLLTFLPLNFYFQFNRFYNIYFLVAALSTIANASSLSPVSQILPLVIVYVCSAVKDIIEDYARYKSDREANMTPVIAIRNGALVKLLSQDLQPGDFIYAEKGVKMSVDAVVISSSIGDGSCFVDTAELDGETNLKRRCALGEFQHLNKPELFGNLKGTIECEMPNANLLKFEGKLGLAMPGNTEPVTLPLSMNQLLLKGTVLRNTDHVFALVLYTGSDTKIIKNLNQGILKKSKLEKQLNYLVLGAFAYNAILLITSVALDMATYSSIRNLETARQAWSPNDYDVYWYLGHFDSNTGTHLLYSIIGYFNIYSYVIPISLFVSMEIVRLFQGQFMRWDEKMTCHRPLDDGSVDVVPMRVNNTNLNEDLGRVQYIFSDKTGTLTQNDMRMAYWYVDGKSYDEMNDPGCLGRHVREAGIAPVAAVKIGHYARAIAICHTVLPNFDAKKKEIIYESQSPEETALLNSMRRNGYTLMGRTKKDIKLEVHGVPEEYEQLAVLEFTSSRKRMSVIVRTTKGIQIYTKGADNVMMARLSTDPETNEPQVVSRTDEVGRELSEQGLRILVVAWAPLSEKEYATFRAALDAAELSLDDREGNIELANAMVEKNMHLLGLTAIEDRLQDLVPETIEFILNCNIRFWLLTGDKQQTAINIGMSSKLITTDMHLMIFQVENNRSSGITAEIDRLNREIDERVNSQRCALVISGEMLEILYKADMQKKFMAIGIRCHSVICSRMTPLQKSLVVSLAQSELNVVTLAIGDGANDVSMIQAANIGVGIAGREGTQAVRAADYAFGEFRFLKRLLVVHGRYNFMRLSGIILISFYKNIAFITVQWLFGFVSLWSGQTVYDTIFFTAFNVIYTSLPPLFYALFEKDVDEVKLEAIPGLYHQVQGSQYWNTLRFIAYLLSGIWHACAVFASVYFANYWGVLSSLGKSVGYWVQCYLFSMPIMLSILIKFGLMTKRWISTSFWGMAFSVATAIVTEPIVEAFNYNFGGIGSEAATSSISYAIAPYYLLCFLAPLIACIPDFIGIYVTHQFHPLDSDIIEEERLLESSRIQGHSGPGENRSVEMTSVF